MKFSILVLVTSCLLSCASSTDQQTHNTDTSKPTLSISLSHIKAYLQLGEIARAENLYQSLAQKNETLDTLLVLAELRAAQNDPTGAQQAFFEAMEHPQFSISNNAATLMSYFCAQKKWSALKGYGQSIKNMDLISEQSNQYLIPIALCFTKHNKDEEAKFWLSQINPTTTLPAEAYLALAKVSMEDQQNQTALDFMHLFEETKAQLSAKDMWLASLIYHRLNRPKQAAMLMTSIEQLFPNWQVPDTALAVKIAAPSRAAIKQVVSNPISTIEVERDTQPKKQSVQTHHIIKKGENLFQLSKTYGVTVDNLLLWNPNLVATDIALGTAIRVISN